MEEKILEIAKRILDMESLDQRFVEIYDFKEHAVWNIKEALKQAYMAGYDVGIDEGYDMGKIAGYDEGYVKVNKIQYPIK